MTEGNTKSRINKLTNLVNTKDNGNDAYLDTQFPELKIAKHYLIHNMTNVRNLLETMLDQNHEGITLRGLGDYDESMWKLKADCLM